MLYSGALVEAWRILRFLGVVDWSSVRSCVIFDLSGVLLYGVVLRCSVGCGVVFQFNGVRRSSRVVIRGYEVLRRLSCVCAARDRVVLKRFGVVFSRFGGVVSWSLDIVTKAELYLEVSVQ